MKQHTVCIGADSAGYEMKEAFKKILEQEGYEVCDCGTNSTVSCHYPEFASAVCKKILQAPQERFGVLICGTGIGMSMCANKFNGIRAAVCGDTYSARLTRVHNDANVLCIGARVIGSCLAEDILRAFLSAEFEGGRHAIRVGMMTDIENSQK